MRHFIKYKFYENKRNIFFKVEDKLVSFVNLWVARYSHDKCGLSCIVSNDNINKWYGDLGFCGFPGSNGCVSMTLNIYDLMSTKLQVESADITHEDI